MDPFEEVYEDGVIIDSIMEKWLEDLCLQEPEPGLVILNKLLVHNIKKFNMNSISVYDASFLDAMRKDLSRVLILQMEMRSFVQDIKRVDAISASLSNGDIDNHFISFVKEIDELLKTRTCTVCYAVIPGLPHGEDLCQKNLNYQMTSNIMEI